MNKYLTAKNIAILVLAVSVIVLFVIMFSRSRQVKDNSAAIEILTRQKQELERENAQLRAKDSTLMKNYELRIINDAAIIEQLKKTGNETIKRITDYNADSLRRAFANL